MYVAMLLLSVLVFVVVVVHYVRSGLCSVFHPFTYYAAFHGLVFVVRPILAHFRHYDRIYTVYRFMPTLTEQMTVIAASSLGLVVFYYFCTRVGNTPMLFKQDPSRAQERVIARRALFWMLAICAPIGLYSLLHNLSTVASNSSTMVISRQGIQINTTGVGYLTDAMLMLVPVCALVPWLYRFRWYALLPLVTFFVLKASTGGRGPFVIAVAVTGLFYFYDKRVKIPGARIALAVAVIGLIFSAIGEDRGYALREALGIKNVAARSVARPERLIEGMDFANMEYMQYLVHVVPTRSGTYDYFLMHLQLFTEPVPRALWKDKPIGPPIPMVRFFDYGTPFGFTMSVPGVGWLELGWVGVAFWCGLWGMATGYIYRRFVTGSQDVVAVSFYLLFLGSLIIVFRDGTLLTPVKLLSFYLFPLVILIIAKRMLKLPSLGQIQRRMMAGRQEAAAVG